MRRLKKGTRGAPRSWSAQPETSRDQHRPHITEQTKGETEVIWKCDMKELVLFAITIALIGCFAYGTWLVAKQVNYRLSYEAMVQQTVCEMVKPEHLKLPCE